MIVLDTNVVSELFRPVPDPGVVSWLTKLTGDVAITAVTLAELFAGVERLPDGRRKTELRLALEGALAPYRDGRSVFPFDAVSARHYAEVLAAREGMGLPISTADAQIAAICLATGAVLATRNVKDFASTGVALVNPWEEIGRSAR